MRTRRSLFLLSIVLGLLSGVTAFLLTNLLYPHDFQARIVAGPGISAGDGVHVDSAIGRRSNDSDAASFVGRYDLLLPGDDADAAFIEAAAAGGVVQFYANPPYDHFALQAASLRSLK